MGWWQLSIQPLTVPVTRLLRCPSHDHHNNSRSGLEGFEFHFNNVMYVQCITKTEWLHNNFISTLCDVIYIEINSV